VRNVIRILREPTIGRARREATFCLAGSVAGFFGFWLIAGLLGTGILLTCSVFLTVFGVAMVVAALRSARRSGGVYRALSARYLWQPVAAPPEFRPGHGVLGRVDARLRDPVGWRAVGYALVKAPVALAEGYVLIVWLTGLLDMTYPLWWPLFRNHPTRTTLTPALVLNPLPPGLADLRISTWPGTLLAFLIGALLVLAAPWLTRVIVTVDGWLIRVLLGPGAMASRVQQLERTRADAVDDSVALLRQVERDLHDGAQMRLAAVAMNLGMARDKLTGTDLPEVTELVDAAQRGAREALSELRVLARGLHPPVLDSGLNDALNSLAAASAIPVCLVVRVNERFSPAIESIAYFCAAELLANANKHSHANQVTMEADLVDRWLMVRVGDDGLGGVDETTGSGLAGLRRRAAAVDGVVTVFSPPGGPTEVTVRLPI
jgi:signal transduction histidine kinase